MAKFNLKTDAKGEIRFNLLADNGQIVLSSEGYKAKASALNGVASVKKHAVDAKNFEVKEAKNGKWHFNLKASNGQVIGSSQMYADKSGVETGMQSVMKNAPAAEVVES